MSHPGNKLRDDSLFRDYVTGSVLEVYTSIR